ncbi:hypothetical protein E4U09_003233 [Claviceps aff. purpurea]|uniref:Uncharacterized protein n=1 Tax=Claviceps aff. purpurea TaxID=1967640 RepID=A0A9P7QHF1_9HYPO|nr:hypothetical protein E4U15_003949 [Claviceps sp. LM218 group G6]KAG6094541.1 hypothetical protein E4U31_006234 [Claviceps sp. LM219 group G6]KAG6292918.1 hypothetical protein E4U09_003233 [Claviceps aff. purpurea]
MPFAFDEPFYFKRGLNRSHESFFAAWAAVASMQGIAPVSMLRSLGFGRLGPIAGSAAANIQSGIGNVTAGSLFSTLQSAGMGGSGAGMVKKLLSRSRRPKVAEAAFLELYNWMGSADDTDSSDSDSDSDAYD